MALYFLYKQRNDQYLSLSRFILIIRKLTVIAVEAGIKPLEAFCLAMIVLFIT